MRRMFVIAVSMLFVQAAVASEVGTYDLGFKAPVIAGKGNNPNPDVGSLIYDTSDSTFYGYGTSWFPLGGASQVVPPGVIDAFAGTTAPTGYLPCNGQAVSRTTYSQLFAAIGTNYGIGDGSTTFNVPDLRGRFVRGYDNGTGRDPDAAGRTATNGGNSGDSVGSLQGDQLASHTHNMTTRASSGVAGAYVISSTSASASYTDNISINAAGGNENRPKNVTVQYIIKY